MTLLESDGLQAAGLRAGRFAGEISISGSEYDIVKLLTLESNGSEFEVFAALCAPKITQNLIFWQIFPRLSGLLRRVEKGGCPPCNGRGQFSRKNETHPTGLSGVAFDPIAPISFGGK
jgi:hypothetical protein